MLRRDWLVMVAAAGIDALLERHPRKVTAEKTALLKEATHLDSARLYSPDLVSQAQAALEGFMVKAPERLSGPEGYYRAVFRSWILPPHLGHAQWDWGDCTARALLAWILLRQMTGDNTTGREVEDGQRRLLLSMLHPDTGLVFVPDKSNKGKGSYYYHVWDQGRTLRALVRWYETSPQERDRLEPLIKRMIEGFNRYATVRGTDSLWGAYAGWPSDEFTNQTPGEEVGWVNMRVGLLIEPLIMYVELTDDPRALDLAIRFANCELGGHEGDSVPDDAPRRPELSGLSAKRDFEFGPDGSFTGHFHTKSATLIGLVKLARYLGTHGRLGEAKRYLNRIREIYDWIFTPDNPNRGSRIGWFPEQLFPNTCRVVNETCCLSDMIELAGAMASCFNLAPEFHSWAELYDDVEAFTVNTTSRSQFRITPQYKKLLADRPTNMIAPALDTATRLEGAWMAKFYPNDHVFVESDGSRQILGWGCCQYSGISALYTGWRDAMNYMDGILYINYFLPRQSPQAIVHARVPLAGEASLEIRQSTRVLIRVPKWLKPSEMELTIGGRKVKTAGQLDATRSYVDLGRFSPGAKIEVYFPLSERLTREKIGGDNHGGNNREGGYCDPKDKITYMIRWRGNYVVALSPRGVYLPLFP